MNKLAPPQERFFQALDLFRSVRLDKADRACRAIISADPTQIDARHLRAMIAMRRKRAGEAIRIMTRAPAI